jgi:hypothetical protein
LRPLAAAADLTDDVDAGCADAAVFVTSLNGVVAEKNCRTSAVPAAAALALFFRGIVCVAQKREIFFSSGFLRGKKCQKRH